MFKSKVLIVLASLLMAMTAHAQLLWKVSGNGLTTPSYIMGTYHLAQGNFTDSVPGLKQALKACSQVYGELDMQPLMNDPAAAKRMQQAMQLPDGQTIDKVLNSEQYKQLNDFLKQTMGTDLNNPAMASLKRLSPAAINTQLQLLLYIQTEKSFNPQDQFDAYFQKYARQNNKKVGGLETIDFQMKILFLNTPIKRQVEQLMCLINNTDYARNMAQRIVKAFYKQNLTEIQKLLEEKRRDACDSTPEEDAMLIYNRNANWAKALPAIMKKGSTFVAVGAGHLPGEKGLLAQLKQQGYQVTPVK